MRCQTKLVRKVIDDDVANNMYSYLRDNIIWEDGIKSRKTGFTRKAKALDVGEIPELDKLIILALSKLTTTQYLIHGIYLNYYENGNCYTPNHRHDKTHQLVISLGETRILTVGTKNHHMENGDAIIFGSSIHGVPQDNSVNGRISIATFMTPIDNLLNDFENLVIIDNIL